MVQKTTQSKKRKTREQLKAERRKVRDDLGSSRDVMRSPEIPGLVFRWVNDELRGGRSRIETLKERGWYVYEGQAPEVEAPNTVVDANVSEGSGGTMIVGVDAKGAPMNAVLMCIDSEIYQIDQKLKSEKIKENEEELMGRSSEDGHYGNIRIGKV